MACNGHARQRRALPVREPGRNRPSTIISPSILSSDFAKLAEECDRMVQLGADWLHVDVMDGHFVPNLTIGAPVVCSLRKHTAAYLDCHLMVSNPVQWVTAFASAGADMFTFHPEALGGDSDDKDRQERSEALAQSVRAAGMHVGCALSPRMQASLLFPLIDKGLLDMVLVMTVEPGFGGQCFQSAQLHKVSELRSRYPNLLVEVDGGLCPSTVDAAAAAGANVVVAGSAIFGAEDPGAVIHALRDSVDRASLAPSVGAADDS